MRTQWHLGVSLHIIAFLPWAAAAAGYPGYDNMYPTSNYQPRCRDRDRNNFCQTDNSTLTAFVESSVPPAGKNIIVFELATDFGGTDLSLKFPLSPSYTGSSETDIIYQVGSGVPSGSDAFTWCDDANSDTRCDQHYVRFRSSSVVVTGLVCHESGHAVGLTHGQAASPRLSQTDNRLGCMVTPTGSDRRLGPNSYYWINATY